MRQKKHLLRIAILLLLLLYAISFLTPFALAYETDDGSTIVYVTASGEKYHTGDCGYLWSSKISMTLLDAVKQGYSRCSRCNPPTYTGVIPTEATEPTETTKRTGNTHSGGHSGNSGSKNTALTASTSPESTKESPSIVENIFLYGLFGLFALPIIGMLLGNICAKVVAIWHKTRPYKRRLLRKKQEELQRQIVLLQNRCEEIKQFRSEHIEQLKAVRKALRVERLQIARLHSCVSDTFGRPHDPGANDSYMVCPGKTCYHRTSCPHAKSAPMHLLELFEKYVSPPPCNTCKPPRPEKWMQDYVELRKQINDLDFIIAFPFSSEWEAKPNMILMLSNVSNCLEDIRF